MRIPERRKDHARRRAVEELPVWTAIIVLWKLRLDAKQIGPALRAQGMKVGSGKRERLITNRDVQQRIKRIMGAL